MSENFHKSFSHFFNSDLFINDQALYDLKIWYITRNLNYPVEKLAKEAKLAIEEVDKIREDYILKNI